MRNGFGKPNNLKQYVCKCGAYFRLLFNYRKHECVYKKKGEVHGK